jgi:hypothetical protein
MSRILRLACQPPVLLSAIAAVLLAAPQPLAAEPAVGVDKPPTGVVAADGKASAYRGHVK